MSKICILCGLVLSTFIYGGSSAMASGRSRITSGIGDFIGSAAMYKASGYAIPAAGNIVEFNRNSKSVTKIKIIEKNSKKLVANLRKIVSNDSLDGDCSVYVSAMRNDFEMYTISVVYADEIKLKDYINENDLREYIDGNELKNNIYKLSIKNYTDWPQLKIRFENIKYILENYSVQVLSIKFRISTEFYGANELVLNLKLVKK